jgi:hypothetical protein
MNFTRFPRITARTAAAGLTILAVSLTIEARPAVAQNGQNGQVHIVKDCGNGRFTGNPGSSYCEIVTSNLAQLPAGTRIHYGQTTGGPTAGPGFLDSNVLVYVRDGQWAVGRCTLPNDAKTPGLCTLSDGVGALAGFSARIVVTYRPGGSGFLFAWDGTYSFKSLPDR